MKMQECVLPVRCVRCSTTFDLWYDLVSRDVGSEEMASVTTSLVDEERLCWECRRSAIENVGQMAVEEADGEELTLDWE